MTNENVESVETQVAQTEKIGLSDLVIAGVLGFLTFFLLQLWEFPGLHPSMWDDAAVASGVRPAFHVMGNYWTFIGSIIYKVCGITAANAMLRFVGHIVMAGIAVCVYALIREMLAFIMRARPQFSKRRTLVQQLAAALGTCAFVLSDPVWNLGQYLSEGTILLALTLAAIEFFFVFLRKGSLTYSYICAIILGLLAAETPVGFILVGAFIFLNGVVLKYVPALESPFFKPAAIEVGKWYMTFLFIAAVVGGIVLNSLVYISHGGLSAIGESVGSIPLNYAIGYAAKASGAASIIGWALWFGVCFTPFVVTMIRFPSAADEELFLPYSTGIVFFICGLLAFTQSCFISALWFWKYGPVHSPYFLACGMLFTATALAAGMAIMGIDAICRNHRRLAKQVYGSDDEDEDIDDKKLEVIHASTTFIRRIGVIVTPIFLVLVMLPGRPKESTRDMLRIVRDAISATVTEAGDAEYIFTDGQLDPAIEIESARRGGNLKCLSLMGGSGLQQYLRTRGMEGDKENLFSFGFDTAMGLRSWIRDRPKFLQKSVVQMGFDLWKRDGLKLPPMGGLLSHPTGFESEANRLSGVQAAYELANRIIAHYQKSEDFTDQSIKNAFVAVQWRIARMCLYRGEAADLAGDAQTAIEDASLAKSLNDLNPIFKDMIKSQEKRNEQMQQKLTPREGLQLALVRADFTVGKLYAETILVADPENADANFAMGMYYLKEKQLTRAATYLKRVLINHPNEPAVYNNLAMIDLALGKLDSAEVNVKKALELLPDSAAVMDTKKAIDAAKKR